MYIYSKSQTQKIIQKCDYSWGYNRTSGGISPSGIQKDKDEGDIHEITGVKLADKTYLSLLPVFKCKNVQRLTKTELCKAALRYGSKGGNISTISEMPIDSYARNVLRGIRGAVKENGKWMKNKR